MSGTNSLHIGIVSWDYDPPIGGMGHHVASLSSGLRAAGHRVSVFSRSNLPLPFGRSILFSFLLGFFLRRWIRKSSLDILHVHAGPGGVFLMTKPKGLPLIVTANHTYVDQVRYVGEQWKRILVLFERRTYRMADSILCISADTALSLRHDYGIAPEKLTVIPCGIDIRKFAACDLPLAERKRQCVFVGRSDRRKGFDLLEAAWKIVQEKIPDAQLHVVGIAAPSMSSVTYHDHCSDQELAMLLGSSRVLVCPSRLEGFGLAAAEAIASGTPVVASDVPGLRSVVLNFETGLLITPDPECIATKLIPLLTEDALWERFHTGCQRQRSAFDASIETEKHIREYLRYTERQ